MSKLGELEDVIEKTVVSTIVAAPIIAGGIGGTIAYYNKVEAKEAAQLKEQTDNDTANSKMLKAAYKGNLKDFKQALEEGASVTTLNRAGRDALMLAVSMGNYEVASYILSQSELANQIDYKRCDDEGICLQDIIESKSADKPSPKLRAIKRIVNDNLQVQIREEAQGKARSDTNFDLCRMVAGNMQEK